MSGAPPSSPRASFNTTGGTGNQAGLPSVLPKDRASALMVTGSGAVTFTGPATWLLSIANRNRPMTSSQEPASVADELAGFGRPGA